MSIVNENTPEDAEMFNVSLTLDPADRTRLGDRVTVSANVATVTIQDNDGKHVMYYHSATTLCVNFIMHVSICAHNILCMHVKQLPVVWLALSGA